MVYRPEWKIAWELIDRARSNGTTFDWLTFSEGYGGKPGFLRELPGRPQSLVGEVPTAFSGRIAGALEPRGRSGPQRWARRRRSHPPPTARRARQPRSFRPCAGCNETSGPGRKAGQRREESLSSGPRSAAASTGTGKGVLDRSARVGESSPWCRSAADRACLPACLCGPTPARTTHCRPTRCCSTSRRVVLRVDSLYPRTRSGRFATSTGPTAMKVRAAGFEPAVSCSRDHRSAAVPGGIPGFPTSCIERAPSGSRTRTFAMARRQAAATSWARKRCAGLSKTKEHPTNLRSVPGLEPASPHYECGVLAALSTSACRPVGLVGLEPTSTGLRDRSIANSATTPIASRSGRNRTSGPDLIRVPLLPLSYAPNGAGGTRTLAWRIKSPLCCRYTTTPCLVGRMRFNRVTIVLRLPDQSRPVVALRIALQRHVVVNRVWATSPRLPLSPVGIAGLEVSVLVLPGHAGSPLPYIPSVSQNGRISARRSPGPRTTAPRRCPRDTQASLRSVTSSSCGSRTRLFGVKDRCPQPIDERAVSARTFHAVDVQGKRAPFTQWAGRGIESSSPRFQRGASPSQLPAQQKTRCHLHL